MGLFLQQDNADYVKVFAQMFGGGVIATKFTFSTLTMSTLKILRCEHRKSFKVCLPFYNIMHERVKMLCQILGHSKICTEKKKNNMYYNVFYHGASCTIQANRVSNLQRWSK